MNLYAHRVAQRLVNQLMPFDETLALETRTHHDRLEVIATAGVVAHFDLRIGNPARDHRLNFLRVHHLKSFLPAKPGLHLSPHRPCESTAASLQVGDVAAVFAGLSRGRLLMLTALDQQPRAFADFTGASGAHDS